MIYLWNIFVDGEFRCTVGSMTEYGAIQSYWNRHGSASRYSGISYDSITAERT